MSKHRDRTLVLSLRSDQLMTRSWDLMRASDRICSQAQEIRKKLRDVQRERPLPLKKSA